MIIRADSELGALLTLFVFASAFIGIFASAVLLVFRKFRMTRKVLVGTLGSVSLYVIVVLLVSLLSPQTIVNIGDSYCMDIWCIAVEQVTPSRREQDTLYKVDVRIFSDANTVKTSAKGAAVYLLDDRGRRFNLVNDPSVIPFDVPLDPRQSIHTTLTFAVASDAEHLFLPTSYHHAGDEGSVPFWVKLYFGSEANYLHKRTLLRVL
ncbi:MAG TPA: hypothetical protein VFR18_22620 [Terriglobia bacterium]|nr:hypothetical protein [Terriglobia bacterium]